jgi:transcriptional regulator with XRE-family HTH domain
MNRVSSFTTRIQELLNRFNFTQADIVRKTGLNKSIVSRYCAGKAQPKTETLNLIATKFFVNPLWLMGYDVSMYEVGGKSLAYKQLADLNERLTDEQRAKVIDMIEIMFSIK